ncbi:hypothetical protein [Ramlibacter sp.]|uniref:hypothetical protein n=1 Tax=Ramlibacter sp. TaxID=1917967 RepID=UPI003D0F4611
MNKAEVVREIGFRSLGLRSLAAAAACAVCPMVFAQSDAATFDAPLASLSAAAAAGAAAETPNARIELSTSSLPRLEGVDNAAQGPRMNLSVLQPKRSGMGLALGMGGFSPASGVGGQPVANTMNFDVGVMYRHTTDGNNHVDVTAWRRMTPQLDAITLVQARQPAYAARVEFNMASVRKSGLVFDRGIGVQLESGARISLKKKDGGAMVYYRAKF